MASRVLLGALAFCAIGSEGSGQCAYQWMRVGGMVGFSGESAGAVRDIAHFHDNTGPALFTGGYGGLVATTFFNCVAKWTGSAWYSPGGGLTYPGSEPFLYVSALRVFDDGGGSRLYAGGTFRYADGQQSWGLARWNGSQWQPVGSGLGSQARVHDLIVFDDGAGPALYAGGATLFNDPGGSVSVAKWDGASWTPVEVTPGPLFGSAVCFASGVHHGAPALYVAGGRAVRVRTNAGWTQLGEASGGLIYAVGTFDEDGPGQAPSVIYAGGDFESMDGVPAVGLARWDGAQWHGGMDLVAHPQAVNSYFRYIGAILEFDDGEGPALYVSGTFASIGGVGASCVARLRGGIWSGAAGNVQGTTSSAPVVVQLRVIDLPRGRSLFGTGIFTGVGGVQTSNVARLAVGPSCCPADANGDGSVNFVDLNACLTSFAVRAYMLPGDVNEDGTVNFTDLNAILAAFGTHCAG